MPKGKDVYRGLLQAYAFATTTVLSAGVVLVLFTFNLSSWQELLAVVMAGVAYVPTLILDVHPRP